MPGVCLAVPYESGAAGGHWANFRIFGLGLAVIRGFLRILEDDIHCRLGRPVVP